MIRNNRICSPAWKKWNGTQKKKVKYPSSFLPSKNKAKIHLFRKFHVWQDYYINDKLTSFVPLYLLQPHIYLLIHAKFFQVLRTGGCWLFSEKQFLNQPISSFRLSDLAREWNTVCWSSGQRLWRNKSTTSPAGVNAGFSMALLHPSLPLSPPFISCERTRFIPDTKYKEAEKSSD